MKLLHLLIARFNIPPPKDKSPENLKVYSETLQAPVGLRVLNIMKCWIDKHYYDFEDNTLKTKLLEFINGVLAHNPLLANWASVLKATIAKKEVYFEPSKSLTIFVIVSFFISLFLFLFINLENFE
jgi:hypothetical protein